MSGLSFSLGAKRSASEAARPGAKKPVKVSDLFGADSDGEDEAPAPQDAKRQRGPPLAGAAQPPARQASAPGARPAPPAAPPAPPAQPPRASPADGPSARPQTAQEKADSVAAMEAYMKMMEKRAADKAAAEAEEEERRNRVPLLNETSFDRRKVTAVFKSDGSRGHHMSDFIPPEELARLLAQGGDAAAKAAAEAMEKKNAISSDNIGHKLLSKMGWKEGEAVGASKSGITAPIQAGGMKQDNLGLGAETHGQVYEGDDAFEQYRKRMMLGYKYRPNPLGNPRKAYY